LLSFTFFFKGVWDAEGGGGKTGAERAALHGFEINTAFDLYNFLKQHHSTVTNSYHEALHQVDKREFHYFPRGTFLAFHPRRYTNFVPSAAICFDTQDLCLLLLGPKLLQL